MAYLSATRRAYLEERLTVKENQLAAAEAQLDELLANPLESYKFDSNEGSQQTKRRSLDDLRKWIRLLETQIDQIWRKLRGGAIVSISLRRR